MEITWNLEPFQSLSPSQVYAVLRLRSRVFVLEQACLFEDADGLDQDCYHLMAHGNDGRLAAYARLVPKGLMYPHMSIGRVVTAPELRKEGLGKLLMERAITESGRVFGVASIQIGAQLYLKEFYRQFGFVVFGEPYLEDGIWHISMLKEQ